MTASKKREELATEVQQVIKEILDGFGLSFATWLLEKVEEIDKKGWATYNELCGRDKTLQAKLSVCRAEVEGVASKAKVVIAASEAIFATCSSKEAKDLLDNPLGRHNYGNLQKLTKVLRAQLSVFQVRYGDFQRLCEEARRACVAAGQECAEGANDSSRKRDHRQIASAGGMVTAGVGGGATIVGAVAGLAGASLVGPFGVAAILGGAGLVGGVGVAHKMYKAAEDYKRLAESFERMGQHFNELVEETRRQKESVDKLKARVEIVDDKLKVSMELAEEPGDHDAVAHGLADQEIMPKFFLLALFLFPNFFLWLALFLLFLFIIRSVFERHHTG